MVHLLETGRNLILRELVQRAGGVTTPMLLGEFEPLFTESMKQPKACTTFSVFLVGTASPPRPTGRHLPPSDCYTTAPS